LNLGKSCTCILDSLALINSEITVAQSGSTKSCRSRLRYTYISALYKGYNTQLHCKQECASQGYTVKYTTHKKRDFVSRGNSFDCAQAYKMCLN